MLRSPGGMWKSDQCAHFFTAVASPFSLGNRDSMEGLGMVMYVTGRTE